MESVLPPRIDECPGACELVGWLSDVMAAPEGKQVHLTPGILITIRIVLAVKRASSIVLADEEYLSPRHFGGLRVSQVEPQALSDEAARRHPDAVLLSSVSWKGRVHPTQRVFGEIRRRMERPPLLLLDIAHAGAQGFPDYSESEADIIVGDAEKWITPLQWSDRLAFAWGASNRGAETLSTALAPFFCTGRSPRVPRASRWVHPEDVHRFNTYLGEHQITLRTLQKKHRQNMKTMRTLADLLGHTPSDSAILWVGRDGTRLPDWLQDSGVVWERPDGFRIACRHEELSDHM